MANGSRDVIVIGAGVIGGATAYELARRGADVLVLDARPVGLGATQAAGGMLAPYAEADPASPLRPLAERSLRLYDRFVADVRADSGCPVGYARQGSLHVALTDEAADRLRVMARELTESGVSCRLLDAAAAREAEPQLASGVAAALLIDDHGIVVARELAQALAHAARRHGAVIHEGEAVRRVALAGRELRVETDTASFTAPHVVLAAGSWSGAVAIGGVPPVPVRPVRGQLLHLASWAEPLRRIAWGPGCYAVPIGERSTLVGATAEEVGFDERATAAGVRGLLDAVCELLPAAATADFVETRVGLRPATPDGLPIVGSPSALPGLVYATGHYRNGVLLAPLTAALVADLVIGGRRDPALAGLSPDRFAGQGGAGRPADSRAS